ncbi:hypothetical protein D1P53_001004 [Cryptococcus gattii VGV]|nr:hypothetical protein D1P53_001004 [Cryptococcus gattii VGV]
MENGKGNQENRSFLSRVLNRHKSTRSQLASAQLEDSQRTTTQLSEALLRTIHLEDQVNRLTSQLSKSSLENASLRNQIETLNSHERDYDKRVSILSRALLKQLAEKRVAQSAYDTVTANVLDTPQRTQDAVVDIMSNTEQHAEIRSFVEEALKKRIRRVTAGDFTGSDLTRAMDMPTSASNENNCWEFVWGTKELSASPRAKVER